MIKGVRHNILDPKCYWGFKFKRYFCGILWLWIWKDLRELRSILYYTHIFYKYKIAKNVCIIHKQCLLNIPSMFFKILTHSFNKHGSPNMTVMTWKMSWGNSWNIFNVPYVTTLKALRIVTTLRDNIGFVQQVSISIFKHFRVKYAIERDNQWFGFSKLDINYIMICWMYHVVMEECRNFSIRFYDVFRLHMVSCFSWNFKVEDGFRKQGFASCKL